MVILTIVFLFVYHAGIQTSLRPKDHRLNFPMDRYFASGIHMTSSQSLGIYGDEKNGISIFKENQYIYIWLVVWNMSFMFPDVGNHPKWRTHIFFRGVETTNQIYILYKQGYINHKFTSRTAQSSGESFKDRTTGEVSCCDSGMAEQMDRKVVEALSCVSTMWGPPVISWFVSPSNYSYTYHKP